MSRLGSPRSWSLGRGVKVLAFLSLGAAYVAGDLIRAGDTLAELAHRFEGLWLERAGSSATLFEARDRETGEDRGFVAVETADGWGGPLTAATWVDLEGAIRRVEVLDHKETPSFYEHVERQGFLDQFPEARASSRLQLAHDVDAVTGATVTSAALTRAVRTGAHRVGREGLGLDIPETPVPFEVGKNELLLILLYAVVLGAVVARLARARLVLLGASVVFLGFVVARPLTLGSFTSILLGYVPGVREQLFWWLLVVGTLALTLLFRRNIYCSWMCPFGGLQEFVTLIGGVKIKLSPQVARALRGGVFVLLWAALMITFLTSNPALGTYEPFAVLFSLKGLGIQWYLVSVAILGSFVIPRFWCRFFCPVGVCLNYTARVGQRAARAAQSLVPARTGRTPVSLPTVPPGDRRLGKAVL